MTEKELDYLANKIATQIIDKLFDSGDLQISYFPPATDEESNGSRTSAAYDPNVNV
jgi:hypothetical protein